MTALLVGRHDGTLVKRIELRGRSRLGIGRSPRCDLTLSASAISRRHALLFRHDHTWHLIDTGSRNGIVTAAGRVQHFEFVEADGWARVGPAYLWIQMEPEAPGAGDGAGSDILPTLVPEATVPVDADVVSALLDDAPPPTPKRQRIGLAVIDAGAARIRRFDLSDRELVTVGRDAACDVTLDDGDVSPLHCVLYTEHSGWCVADTDSRSGTQTDGRTWWRRRLVSDQLVRIGGSLMWIEGGGEHHRRRDVDVDVVDAAGETLAGGAADVHDAAPVRAESAFLDEPGDRL